MKFLLLIIMLLATGCTKSFLDTHPHGTYENHPDADKRHTWQCVTDRIGNQVDSGQIKFKGENYFILYYDRNEDGNIDAALVYAYIPGGKGLRPFPDRYILLEGDKTFEYVDMQGNGRCQDIVSVSGNQGEQQGKPLAKPRQTPIPKHYEIPADPNGEEGDCQDHHSTNPKEQA